MDAIENGVVARSELFGCFLRTLLASFCSFACDFTPYLCHCCLEESKYLGKVKSVVVMEQLYR